MRYIKSKNKKDIDTENRIKELPIYIDMEPSANDLYIKAIDGTRLDILSNQYYGTVKYWWVIALANKMGKGTLYVTPGYQLRIPASPERYAEAIR
tara:strand:+ start:82 stop:366 length:285 start_codon:yes stop_codon:yes gene_type:complete